MATAARDWRRTIAELEAAGYQSALTCVGRAELDRIKAGAEPGYSTGELLLALHDVLAGGEKTRQNPGIRPPG